MKVRWSRAGRPVLGFCGGSKGASRRHGASLGMVPILTPPRWGQLTAALLGLATRAKPRGALHGIREILPFAARTVEGH